MKRFKSEAFTLIELLVVIVIIGILVTVSVPVFGGSIEKARMAKGQAFDSQIRRMLGTDLVGQWSFDGDATDSSGNNFNAATSLTNYVEGVYGQAIDASSGGSVIFGQNSRLYESPVFTLSMWVNQQEDNGGSGNSNIIFGNEHYLNNGFRAGLDAGRPVIWTSQSGGTGTAAFSGKKVKLGAWRHIVFSYDGDTLYTFLDGELGDKAVSSYVPGIPSGSGIRLNGGVGGTTSSKSYFDEVRWYNAGIDIDNF